MQRVKMYSVRFVTILICISVLYRLAEGCTPCTTANCEWTFSRRVSCDCVSVFFHGPKECKCTAVNCDWTWSSWSQCNCNNKRVRDVVIRKTPSCGGNECPSKKHETQTCQSQHAAPATLKDMKDAAWACRTVYTVQDKHLNKTYGKTGYKITHIINKSFKNDFIRFLVAETFDTVIVAFRGSTKKQIFGQFESFISNQDGIEVTISGMKTRVLQYPWDAMNILKSELSKIDSVWKPTKRVLISGHSFGGSLASIFAAHAMTENSGLNLKKNSWLITFGQPRVGDEAFARTHDQIFPPIRKLRIMNEMDIVPHIPPRVPIKYTHFSRGIWLKEKTQWTVCRRLESSNYCGDENMLDAGNGNLNSVEVLLEKVMTKTIDHSMAKYIEKLNHPASSVKYCSIPGKCQEFKDIGSALSSVCLS